MHLILKIWFWITMFEYHFSTEEELEDDGDEDGGGGGDIWDDLIRGLMNIWTILIFF